MGAMDQIWSWHKKEQLILYKKRYLSVKIHNFPSFLVKRMKNQAFMESFILELTRFSHISLLLLAMAIGLYELLAPYLGLFPLNPSHGRATWWKL